MTQILQQPDRDVEITIIYMWKALMEKVENSHEQMENFSREMEIPRKCQMGMLQIKKEINNKKHYIWNEKFLYGLINRLDTFSKESVNLNTDQ